MRVKCLAQEHNTMSPAGARTRTARSGVEGTNHEVTDFQGVVLNSTGAEVQNEQREQRRGGGGGAGGMIFAKKT